jgi:hypothetical protein
MLPHARFVTDRDGDLTRDPSRDPTKNLSRRRSGRDQTLRTAVHRLPPRKTPPGTLWLRVLLLIGTAATFSLSALALAASAVLVLCMLS